MVLQPLLGPYGKIPVLIRDDDTNYFTKTGMLESIYSRAWEKGFKICFAVVPLQRGTNDISVPPAMRMKDSFFSIIDNKQLVKYLKGKLGMGSIEVLQHGLSHYIGNDGRWEFGENSDKKQDIYLGRNILRKAFEISPKFFVPPGEDITKKNLLKLIESGFIPICRRTPFDTFLRNAFVPQFLKHTATRLVAHNYKEKHMNGNTAVQFLKPVIIKMSKNLISWSVPLMSAKISSPESLFNFTNKVIEASCANRSPVCIINHYHVYYYDWNSSITRNELFQCWTKILEKFQDLKFRWCTTFLELYERVRKIQNIQVAETGSKITIESKVPIKGFSIRAKHYLESSNSALFDRETKILTLEDLMPNRKVILYEKN